MENDDIKVILDLALNIFDEGGGINMIDWLDEFKEYGYKYTELIDSRNYNEGKYIKTSIQIRNDMDECKIYNNAVYTIFKSRFTGSYLKLVVYRKNEQ